MAFILGAEFDVTAFPDHATVKAFIRDHSNLRVIESYNNFKLKQVKESNFMSFEEKRKVWGWYGFMSLYSSYKLNRIGNSVVYFTRDPGAITFGSTDFPPLYPETMRKRHEKEQHEVERERRRKETSVKRKQKARENARRRKTVQLRVSEEEELIKAAKKTIAENAKKTGNKAKTKKELVEKARNERKTPAVKKEKQQNLRPSEDLKAEADLSGIPEILDAGTAIAPDVDCSGGTWTYNITGVTDPIEGLSGANPADFSSRVG